MPQHTFEYCGYLVMITENSIYHDFEFVIKTLDKTKVIGTNTHFLENYESAEVAAKILINELK